jgi:hypothetical protein
MFFLWKFSMSRNEKLPANQIVDQGIINNKFCIVTLSLLFSQWFDAQNQLGYET